MKIIVQKDVKEQGCKGCKKDIVKEIKSGTHRHIPFHKQFNHYCKWISPTDTIPFLFCTVGDTERALGDACQWM